MFAIEEKMPAGHGSESHALPTAVPSAEK